MTAKDPVLLLHGVAMSGNAWATVAPLLGKHHQV